MGKHSKPQTRSVRRRTVASSSDEEEPPQPQPQPQAGVQPQPQPAAEAAAAAQAEAESQPFTSLERLREEGVVSAADVARLRAAGYSTVESVAMTSSRRIAAEVEGFSDVKTRSLKKAVERLTGGGFCTGREMLEARRRMARIGTGSGVLDAALGGGVETGSMTEVFGESRAGKSQLCHQLSVMCQLSENEGGVCKKSIYIDTEGTFRPERIADMARRHVSEETRVSLVLENIVYCRVYSVDQQMDLVRQGLLAELLSAGGYGLVVVDSVTALFRAEYQGRGELAERQQTILQFVHGLQRLCDEYGVAIVISNQVSAAVDAGHMTAYMNPALLVKPVGGHVLGHASQTRLFLRKAGTGEKRICRIYDSPLLPEVDAIFAVTATGIADWIEPAASARKK